MADFVYIVQCADRSFYTGVTNNLDRRIRQHNGLLWGGARYTRSRRPVKLSFVAVCADRRAALLMERRLKRLDHASKARLAS